MFRGLRNQSQLIEEYLRKGCDGMNKTGRTENMVVALAYFHRYGWIAAMMVCVAVWLEEMIYILAAGFLGFSVWSFLGYRRKWKHIYCSFQNACHQKMTPDNVQWHKVKKSDAYGTPLVFLVLGLALLGAGMLR